MTFLFFFTGEDLSGLYRFWYTNNQLHYCSATPSCTQPFLCLKSYTHICHLVTTVINRGFPYWLRWSRICLQCRRPPFSPRVRKIPWRRNGSPLQYSCLEHPMVRGAWQAAVHVVAKSQTRLVTKQQQP